MAFLTIEGTTYRARSSTGGRIQIENRFRAMDGSLVRGIYDTKKVASVEIIGPAAGGLFTIAEADTLMALLSDGNVTVAGDIGSFEAAARDIGYTDLVAAGAARRTVSATLEEV